MMTMTDMVDITDLPAFSALTRAADAVQSAVSSTDPALSEGSLEDQEKKLVSAALTRAGGNQSEAARELRIGRDALRYKMKKFGLG
jgi:transcriptional regulator with PAS, ATPase and Fis domain